MMYKLLLNLAAQKKHTFFFFHIHLSCSLACVHPCLLVFGLNCPLSKGAHVTELHCACLPHKVQIVRINKSKSEVA